MQITYLKATLFKHKIFYIILCSLGLIGTHIYALPNRWYILILVVFLGVSFIICRSLLLSFWQIYLTILPFQRSRQFLATEISVDSLYSKMFDYSIRFSDLLLIIFIYLLLRVLFKNQPTNQPLKYLNILLVMFTTLVGVSVTEAVFFSYSLYYYFLFLGVVIHFFIAQAIPTNISKPFWTTTVAILTLHVVMMTSLIGLQYNRGSQLGIELEHKSVFNPYGAAAIESAGLFRPAGYFHDANAAATWLLMLMPIVTYFVYKNFPQSIAGGFLLAIILSILVTGSRVGWIVLALNILSFTSLSQRFKFKKSLKTFFVMLIISSLLISPFIWKRITSTTYTFMEGGGVDYRKDQILASIEILKTRPLGIGLGMLQFVAKDSYISDTYTTDLTQPHNIMAEVASGTGVIGLVVFALVIYILFKHRLQKYLHQPTMLHFVILLTLSNYFFMANFYPYLLRSPISEFFWLFAAVNFSSSTLVLKK